MKGKKHTYESRLKMSESHKGKKLSKETIRKMSGKIPWNKGKKCSYKEKISKTLLGRKLSDETKNKMSISRKGRIISEETRKKISVAKKGRKMTLEHKNNMINSLNRSPNKFEEECIALFKNNNLPLKFVGGFNDKQFFIAGRVPDFVSTNNKKVIVEVFYEFFKIKQYGSIDNYKKERYDLFYKYGWKTLFFSYDEIRFNPLKCIDIIKKEVE